LTDYNPPFFSGKQALLACHAGSAVLLQVEIGKLPAIMVFNPTSLIAWQPCTVGWPCNEESQGITHRDVVTHIGAFHFQPYGCPTDFGPSPSLTRRVVMCLGLYFIWRNVHCDTRGHRTELS
jgi:hypothetical protein